MSGHQYGSHQGAKGKLAGFIGKEGNKYTGVNVPAQVEDGFKQWQSPLRYPDIRYLIHLAPFSPHLMSKI